MRDLPRTGARVTILPYTMKVNGSKYQEMNVGHVLYQLGRAYREIYGEREQ